MREAKSMHLQGVLEYLAQSEMIREGQFNLICFHRALVCYFFLAFPLRRASC